MDITNIFSLLGGLALFLFGMNVMSNGLEVAAGNKMKSILEKLTSNRFLGVTVGALITAVIQSSSATTVMVVGFVNSGLMKLENAVWVIMGANIGTTITGQLVALDVGEMAPLIAFIGVALTTFVKNKRVSAIGSICAGLGILFMGMEMMSAAMSPLRDVPEFVNLMASFSNPILGILFGAIFTAVIQSSSASVGILQALAMSGVVTLDSAIYVLFGQNIGTCITSVLAAIGTDTNAKRATCLHLMFNVIGTTIFVIISFVVPLVPMLQATAPGSVATQIANTHTVFNVVTTLLLLPLGNYMVKLSKVILKDKPSEMDELGLKFLDFSIFNNAYHVGTAAIVNAQLFNEVQNMLSVASDNVRRSFDLLIEFDEGRYERLEKYEEYVNYLNKQIVSYTTNVISTELPIEGTEDVGAFLTIANDIERIGDHAMNIAHRAKQAYENDEKFSGEAVDEITIMSNLTHSILEELQVISTQELSNIVENVDVIEDNIDRTTTELTQNQMARLKAGACQPERSLLFTKILTDFERIGDHGLNVAKKFAKLSDVITALRMKEGNQ